MQDENIFGEDAGVFRPDRCVEVEEAERDVMARTADLVLGHERWICAGKGLALLELGKGVFEVSLFCSWNLRFFGPGCG